MPPQNYRMRILFNITTLGFRGEALPSIGAVSRLRLTSRAEGSDDAWSLLVEGGNKHAPEPASSPQGTKVEVSDLFFATPARLKFMKAVTTEVSHITDIMNRISMSHPEISFSLKDEKRTILDHPKVSDKLERLSKIMGADFKDNALQVDSTRNGAHLSGYAGLPTLNRGNSSLQYLFVNGRPVKDKLLNGALRAAYQDFLARDRHPLVVLYLDLPAEEVDINVHPAKTEVRFRDPGLVRGLIVGALKETLNGAGHRASTTVAQAALGAIQAPSNMNLAQEMPAQSPSFARNYPAAKPIYQGSTGSLGLQRAPKPSYDYPAATPVVQAPTQPLERHDALNHYPLGHAQAQLHETYIVAESKDGIVIVDQHAAHERLVYEKMKKDIAEKGLQRQILLVPEFVELNESQAENLLKYKDELESFGLVLELMGEKNILVREVPSLLGDFNVGQLIHDLVDEIDELGSPLSLKEKMEEILGTIACHGSIRSGKRMSLDEMNALLRQMEETPHSGQCNHGRPTYVELSKIEIEKLFGRR